MPNDTNGDTSDNTPPAKGEAAKPTVKAVGSAALEQGKKAAAMVDKASTVAEGASNAFGAIKWTAIAIVTIIFAGGAYGIYKVVSAPVKAVGDATEAVTESVKVNAEKLKDTGADVAKRLFIPVKNTRVFNQMSEAAFEALIDMETSEPDGVKDRLYRAKNFRGNDGRVCQFGLDFGNGELPVTLAADNESYASSKALGSKNNRTIRMIVEAGKDDLALSSVWDEAAQAWQLKWKATTIKKSVDDAVAAKRALDVLGTASVSCE